MADLSVESCSVEGCFTHPQQHSAAVLPRNTVVLISGNNRTKKSLVGHRAVVKRCVGLGGWHHVLLEDGTEVKLQRNALSVLEMGPQEPVGDGGSSSDTEATRERKLETLHTPQRVRRPPRPMFEETDLPVFRRAEASNSSGMRSTRFPLVGLHKLETTSLKRYRHTFQLPGVDAAAPKADLLSAVTRHFTTQEVDEDEVLCGLVIALRRRYKQQQHQHQQRLLFQQLSPGRDYLHCHQQQQLQRQQQQEEEEGEEEEEGDEEGSDSNGADAADEQLRRLILLQQRCVYFGPSLFQQQPQQ